MKRPEIINLTSKVNEYTTLTDYRPTIVRTEFTNLLSYVDYLENQIKITYDKAYGDGWEDGCRKIWLIVPNTNELID